MGIDVAKKFFHTRWLAGKLTAIKKDCDSWKKYSKSSKSIPKTKHSFVSSIPESIITLCLSGSLRQATFGWKAL
jgi:ribosomal protein S2